MLEPFVFGICPRNINIQKCRKMCIALSCCINLFLCMHVWGYHNVSGLQLTAAKRQELVVNKSIKSTFVIFGAVSRPSGGRCAATTPSDYVTLHWCMSAWVWVGVASKSCFCSCQFEVCSKLHTDYRHTTYMYIASSSSVERRWALCHFHLHFPLAPNRVAATKINCCMQ